MSKAKLKQLGRYKLVAELGRGAMGVVYEAEDPLLNRAETLAFLGISDRTLYRYQDRGLLRPYRTAGGHRRFRRSDLEALLERAAS